MCAPVTPFHKRNKGALSAVTSNVPSADTTTPTAMARTTAHLLTSDWLSATSRDTLAAWMVATTTGKKRLRAGLPADWRAGDKTGTAMAPGMRDKYNDVAIVWPPGKAPIVITAFLETRHSQRDIRDEDQAVLAEVGRIATACPHPARCVPHHSREVVFITMSRKVGFSLAAIAEQLPAYRAGRLRISDMVESLLGRIVEIDQQTLALAAQRAEVVSHIAWLQAQEQHTPKPSRKPFPQPTRKRKTP